MTHANFQANSSVATVIGSVRNIVSFCLFERPGAASGQRLAQVCRARTNCVLTLAVVGLLATGHVARAQDGMDKAWSILQTGATAKEDNERAIAVQVLGIVPNNTKAVNLATNALQDNDAEVRASAAAALGPMQAKDAMPKLEELIKTDQDPSVIMASARSLITLGNPLGYNVYYAILTGEKKSGQGLLDSQKKMLHDPKRWRSSDLSKA